MNNKVENNLVFAKNNQAVTDSRTVAKYFGKRPRDVNKRIGKIMKMTRRDTIAPHNHWFYRTSFMYHGQRGFKYYMNKDGFMETVLGFRGKKAEVLRMQFVEAFDRMSRQLRNPISVLMTMPKAGLAETAVKLAIKAKDNQRDAEYTRKAMQSGKLMPINVIAQDFGYNAGQLNSILHSLHVQYKQGGYWHLYTRYRNRGLAGYKHYANPHARPSLQWSEYGRRFIRRMLAAHGLLPHTVQTQLEFAFGGQDLLNG